MITFVSFREVSRSFSGGDSRFEVYSIVCRPDEMRRKKRQQLSETVWRIQSCSQAIVCRHRMRELVAVDESGGGNELVTIKQTS